MKQTRKQVLKKIEVRENKILYLEKEIKSLRIQEHQICDEDQVYYEDEVELILRKRPKKTRSQRRGIIKWGEDFTDKDSHEVVTIERTCVVMEDGVWFV